MAVGAVWTTVGPAQSAPVINPPGIERGVSFRLAFVTSATPLRSLRHCIAGDPGTGASELACIGVVRPWHHTAQAGGKKI
jgi:hypothetical protein